jgi:hypothetical protein
MSKFIRCHLVEAKPMTRGAYNKKRGWTVPANENPKDKGYIVKYPDGYVSWCPKAQFEAQGFPIENGTTISEKDVLNFVNLGYNGVSTIKARGGKPVTVMEREYPTGFTAFETATCVDPANYSEEIGASICSQRLNTKLWGFLGFMLQWATHGIVDLGMKYAKEQDAADAAKKNQQ